MSLSRRELLRSSLATSALAGALGLPRIARADGIPTRFVVVFHGNGPHRDVWQPSGSESSFSLSPVLEPLADFQDKLLVCHDITSSFHGHGEGVRCALTANDGDSTSIDQLVADLHSTRLKSLVLGVQSGGGTAGQPSYAGPGLPIPTVQDPRIAYENILRATETDPAALEANQALFAAVKQSVDSDFTDVLQGLSPTEGMVLEAHQREAQDLFAALADPPPVGTCSLDEPGTWPDTDDDDNHPELCRLQIENVVNALQCDVTRVASLCLGAAEQCCLSFSWMGISDDAHSIAHGTVDDALNKKLAIDRFYAEQFAYLLALLDAVPEGKGSMLDHTVCLWITELGVMRDFSVGHQRETIGAVVAGGSAAGLETGRLLDLSDHTYGDFLMTLGNACGLELRSFGAEGTRTVDTLFG